MTKIHIPQSAVNKHLDAFHEPICLILKRLIDGKPVVISGERYEKDIDCDVLKCFFAPLYRFFEVRENSLLVAMPNVIREAISEVHTQLSNVQAAGLEGLCRRILKNLFSFRHFATGYGLKIVGDNSIAGNSRSGWSAGAFIRELGVRCCPYCNAEAIYSVVIEKHVSNAENPKNTTIKSSLDHYYLKSEYPYLALSLHNLVPSCARCNTSIKGKVDFAQHDYANPYEDDIHAKTLFSYILTGESRNVLYDDDCISLFLKARNRNADKELDLMRFFQTEEIYNTLFRFEAANIIATNRRIVSEYGKRLRKDMPDLTDEQFNRLVYGCSLNPSNINKERLSKMTIDLVGCPCRRGL